MEDADPTAATAAGERIAAAVRAATTDRDSIVTAAGTGRRASRPRPDTPRILLS